MFFWKLLHFYSKKCVDRSWTELAYERASEISKQGYIFLPKVDFFLDQVKLQVDFIPLFSREVGRGGSAPQAKILKDRLGYSATSMNYETESFTYVILLINIDYMFL